MMPKPIFSLILLLCLLTGTAEANEAAVSDPESEWKQMNMNARDLLLAGKKAEAVESSKAALEFARKNLGAEHPSIAKSLNNLGVIYFMQGDAENAKKYYEEALVFTEQKLGSDHAYIADTLINRARLEFAEKHYGETLTDLKRSLKLREKHFGPDSEEVAQVLAILAGLYQRMGLTEEAQQAQNRLKDIQQKVKA